MATYCHLSYSSWSQMVSISCLEGQRGGLIAGLARTRTINITNLQYTDDTLIFRQSDIR